MHLLLGRVGNISTHSGNFNSSAKRPVMHKPGERWNGGSLEFERATFTAWQPENRRHQQGRAEETAPRGAPELLGGGNWAGPDIMHTCSHFYHSRSTWVCFYNSVGAFIWLPDTGLPFDTNSTNCSLCSQLCVSAVLVIHEPLLQEFILSGNSSFLYLCSRINH